MEGSSYQHFQNQHKGLGFGTINFSDYQGLEVSSSKNAGLGFGTINFSDYQGLEVSSSKNAGVLSQEVQNLALKDSVNGNENVEGGPVVSNDRKHKKQNYPVRPEVENCLYFMQYGWCKFGFNCRYNHPFNQTIQVAQANKEITKPGEENLNSMEQFECKYYLKPEGCKNEKACGYNHSGRKTVVAPVLGFNFLGLPIRPGEKECPHFKRNGSCKYGSNCWFDHPDPSLMGEGFPHSGYTGLGDTMPCWSLAGPVNEFGPFDPYFYQPEEFAPYSEWVGVGHQVPVEHHEAPIYTTSDRSQSMPAAFSMKTAAAYAKPYQPKQPRVLTKDSPKPEVQPERIIKFGFGFHHPKTSLCPLNDRGLPIRPDTEVCAFYDRYGVCKEGPACRFNHPATLRKAVPPAGSKEAQVPAAGSQEAQVPPAGSQEAQPPQLPDPTTQDKN